MQYLFRLAICMVFSLSLSGIAQAQTTQSTSRPTRFQTLHISKVVLDADKDTTSPDEVKYYDDLEVETKEFIAKCFKGEGFTVTDAASNESNSLVINTKIKFNAGNQALRWVGGLFGAGKASAEVVMEAVESTTGKIVATRTSTDSMRMGGFGGKASSFLIGVVDDAWNYVLEDIYKAQ